ncbi:SRPBCC family protein [Geoalkalibacter halelectricus]|uniref:SRPBCC family protein n=1 Tax=Geoalkalibacter halelectricus TaxID=2847045 RepID=A0ABY5ZPF9_9BACT|nr:SRPBCC family protein [Geoalkalibacter halelectricus]MDO3379290.1 SRPBCC family protein [Geoalkalibacter halelectricus]UWZ81045.1 SRPBCC family protein [Geoalkalibacter halelectricus]
MKIHRLFFRQRLPVDPDSCWTFFSDPANLREITPPSLDLRVTSTLLPRMHAGMIICYRIRPLAGMALTWVTEITQVREPFFFVDEQRFGPYRFWHHQHHFRPVTGGVEMDDEVHYALPLGWLGAAANQLLVRRRLEHIFSYRREILCRRFGVMPQNIGP